MDHSILLLVLLCALTPTSDCSGGSGRPDACSYSYAVQPWQNPVLTRCNPRGADITIACSVRGPAGDNSSFGITWHRAGIEDTGRLSAKEVPINEQRHNGTVDKTYVERSSTLTITNLSIEAYGYYWCEVTTNSTHTAAYTPSQKVLIVEPCNAQALPRCSSPLELSRARDRDVCAEEETALPAVPNCMLPTTQPLASAKPSRISHTKVTVGTIHTRIRKSRSGEESTHPSTRSGGKSGSGEDEEGLEQYRWLLIGVSAAISLGVIIAVLVTLIVCVECRKRRIAVRGAVTTSTDMETAQTELVGNGSGPTSLDLREPPTNGRRVHPGMHDYDYTEIPNFMEAVSTGVYQNVKESDSSKPGYYDDVLPDLSCSVRRHSYDKVIDDELSGYHRLQHKGSVCSQASQWGLRPQTSRHSSTATDITNISHSCEFSIKSPEGSHHRINIYDEGLGSQSSNEEEYHRLDRHTSTTTPTASSKPLAQLSPDRAEVLEDCEYSKLDLKPAPTNGERSLQQTDYKVQQHKSVHRAPLQDRGNSSCSGSATVSRHSKEGGEVCESAVEMTQSEFESLYSPPSEFGVVIAKTDEEDCETRETLGPAQTDTYEYTQTETVDSWVKPITEGKQTKAGGASVCTTKDPSSPNKDDLQSPLPTGGANYYNCPETQERVAGEQEFSGEGKRTRKLKPVSQPANGEYSHLELECPVHNYTPIIPTQQNVPSVYNVPIISNAEMYRSEQGHLYHVLESDGN